MKKILRATACIMLILTVVLMPVQAILSGFVSAEEGAQWFTSEQLQAASGRDGLYLRQLIRAADGFYGYASDMAVYHWDETEEAVQLYCQLPAFPKDSPDAYEDLPDEAKAQWEATVSFIASGEEGIYGVNLFSGKLGKITENGMTWTDVTLDTEKLTPDGRGWPLRIVQAFVERERLYVYAAHDDAAYPHNRYDLFAFDLTTGECATLDIRNAQGLCTYEAGSLLLLFYEEDQWVTRAFDLSSGELAEGILTRFAAAYDDPVSGIAYDVSQGQLYMTAQSQAWRCQPGSDFVSLGAVPLYDLVEELPGFLLRNGSYAVYQGELYVHSQSTQRESTKKLMLAGCMDDTIYRSFVAENPQVAVSFDYELLPPDEIARRLVVQDRAVDVYATMADNSFYFFVNKGYAASLSSSAVLTDDIASMYPNIRQVLQDNQGNPIAYPYSLQLGNWSVNITLWREAYGDQPLPETVDQFLDAMKSWEETLWEKYPDASFAGAFDYVQWIRNIVNAYVQQRVEVGKPAQMQDTLLRRALEKLAEIRQIRRDNGKGDTLETDELMPIELFVTAGYNNILTPPLDSALYDMSFEELPEGVYQPLPPLVFEQGEEPQMLGKLLVWFVNPFSQNKELAIRYLEHAAMMKNNPTMYYGAHPEVNEPIEFLEYAGKKAELDTAAADLMAQLQKEGLDAMEKEQLTGQLEQVQENLASLEQQRWMIDPDALADYRQMASSIRFYEDNPYLMLVGSQSDSLEQVMDVYQSYADGAVSLDNFLMELEGRLEMIAKEGN